jgi:hypothetical protein
MSPEKLPIVAKDQLQKAISAGSHPALMAARIPVGYQDVSTYLGQQSLDRRRPPIP